MMMMTLERDLAARILVVEDDEVVATDLTRTLEGFGCEVVAVVADADEAVRIAGEELTDLVLMDIRLRGSRDGVYAGKAIAKAYDLPVVYLTSHSDPVTLARAKESSPYGYVVKPFTDNTLRTTIEIAIRRHLLESLLKEAEERHRATLRSMTDAVVTTDEEGVITFVNPAAELLLAQPAVRLVGARVVDAVRFVNSRGESVTSPFHSATGSDGTIYLTGALAVTTASGRRVPVGGTVSPIGGAGRKTFGAVAVLRDATMERVFDAGVAEARVRRVLEGELWAYFLLDGEWKVRECNAAFATLLGTPVDDALGADLSRLLADPSDRERLRQRLDAVGGVASYETELRRPDGGLVNAVLWLRPDGEERGRLVGHLMDVTHLVRARREAEQARRMEVVGRLAGGVAHQFNNLLTVILGHADLMAEELRGGALEEDVSAVREAAEKAGRLVDQLLATGRRRTQPPEPFSLEEVVRDALGSFAPALRQGFDFRVEADDGLSTVFADRGSCRASVVALLQNAVDAMPDGGTVQIHIGACSPAGMAPFADVERGYVCVRVEDEGVGMDEETLERAAEPFFVAGSGVGLGLAAAQGFAAQSGGWLSLTSRPGEGTTVTLVLPTPGPAA